MKHIGTDKEPNQFEPDTGDEVWIRYNSGELVKVEVPDDDPETGQ